MLVVVDEGRGGHAFLARFLADPQRRGWARMPDALNLDGGPSTQIVAKLPGLELSLPGGWGAERAGRYTRQAVGD